MELEQAPDTQVLELSQRVKLLGQPHAESKQAYGDVDYAELEEWDPHILLAVAKAKLSRGKGKSTTYGGHRKLWDDRSLILLFERLLKKDALMIFETLPTSVRSGTFDEVVEAMRARLCEDNNSARLKAMTALRKLTMREGQSVAEFCLVLERVASRAYPDTPPEAVSLQKAEILFNQLARWEGSYTLADALETSAKEEVYEKVKETALRLERTRRTANEMAQDRVARRTPLTRPGEQRGDSGSSYAPEASGLWETSSNEGSQVTDDEVVEERLAKSQKEVKCFKCGKVGHIARHCTAPKVSLRAEKAVSGRPLAKESQEIGSFSALLDKLLCTTSRCAEFVQSEGLFGEKSVVPVKMMGIELVALLDTGSETSIIPLNVFHIALEKKVDVDRYVKRIPRVEAIVRNASGERMSFVDTIKMEVTMKGETKPIAFHVGEGLDDIVILGTNALEAFGLELRKVKQARLEKQLNKDDEDTSMESRAQKRVFLVSGCMKCHPNERAMKRRAVLPVTRYTVPSPRFRKNPAESLSAIRTTVRAQPTLITEGRVGYRSQHELATRVAMKGQRSRMKRSLMEEAVKCAKKSTLVFLPFGFRGFKRIVAATENVRVCLYKTLADVCERLKRESALYACVFVSPTTVRPIEENFWLQLYAALSAQVSQGTKVIAVCGPRGEKAWEQNRHKTIKMFELMRGAATAATRHNVVTMFGKEPAFKEPCVTMGIAPRKKASDGYPVHLMKEFLVALQAYIAEHIENQLFKVYGKTVSTNKANEYRERCEPEHACQVLRSVGMTENESFQESNHLGTHGMHIQGSRRPDRLRYRILPPSRKEAA
ncbi:hypothetical protein Y032_0781g2301 [Ancylostoma ceylanicum]|uniref:CCHC-type domain-containing protein n=1 Tax=Ancylostoma ceylanicum TaxID=53326 RepID=A0A016WCL8_9BILA|nr:hypothetical protein Y032_0781g2301 [Ancylostoma ceylanicum]